MEKDMLSPRLERLKTKLLEARPEVYAERACLVTQAYRETENEMPAVKRARVMDKILTESTIWIKDDELIVLGEFVAGHGHDIHGLTLGAASYEENIDLVLLPHIQIHAEHGFVIGIQKAMQGIHTGDG